MTSAPTIPLIRRLRSALPYLVVFAAGVFLYDQANNFEFEQEGGRIGPGAWPKLILALMLVTALWGIISAFRAGRPDAAEAESDQDEALARPPEIYPLRVWLAVAATVIYLLLLPIFGFFLTTIAFSAALMALGQFHRPVPLALLSAGISLFFVFMFMRVVYVELPLGIAPFNEVSFALMRLMGVH